VFRGVTNINLDAKGRMAMPTRYRERLAEHCAGQMVVTIDPQDHCLLIYPIDEWEVLQRKLEALPTFNKQARRVQRMLIGHATDIDIDGSGRLLLSQPLRDYAQLDKKTVLLGQGKKFELWSEDLWLQRRDAYIEDNGSSEELPDELLSLSL